MPIDRTLSREGVLLTDGSLRAVAEAVRTGLVMSAPGGLDSGVLRDSKKFGDLFLEGYHKDKIASLKTQCNSPNTWYLRFLSGHLCNKSFEEDCDLLLSTLTVPGEPTRRYTFLSGLETWSRSGDELYMGAVNVEHSACPLKCLGHLGEINKEWIITLEIKGLPRKNDVDGFLKAIATTCCYTFIQLIAPDGETTVASCCVAKDWESPFCGKSQFPQYTDGVVRAWENDESYEKWHKYHEDEVVWAEGWDSRRFIDTVRGAPSPKEPRL